MDGLLLCVPFQTLSGFPFRRTEEGHLSPVQQEDHVVTQVVGPPRCFEVTDPESNP